METWQEARYQRPLRSLCFRANRKTKKATSASDWLRHFRLLWNRWTEFNEIDRKHALNVLYEVCVYRADRKTKMAALAPDWLRHFRLLLWNRWIDINEIGRKQDLNVLYEVCVFLVRSEKPRWPHRPLIVWDIFDWNSGTELKNTWHEARYQRPIQSLCFSGRSVT